MDVLIKNIENKESYGKRNYITPDIIIFTKRILDKITFEIKNNIDKNIMHKIILKKNIAHQKRKIVNVSYTMK